MSTMISEKTDKKSTSSWWRKEKTWLTFIGVIAGVSMLAAIIYTLADVSRTWDGTVVSKSFQAAHCADGVAAPIVGGMGAYASGVDCYGDLWIVEVQDSKGRIHSDWISKEAYDSVKVGGHYVWK